ncbi:MAG: hypothetical protein OEL53_11565 [Rhodospirillales bacterium]|nr:hypothetical protein [Rhodospirillales bacterium]
MKFIDPAHIPATGNLEIDRDHQMLAALMNKIYEDWQKGLRCPEMAASFDELRIRLGGHFSKEITIARGSGYAQWAAHHQQHKEFLKRFDAFMLECRQAPGSPNANIEVFMELERHLFEHEVLADQDMWGLWPEEKAAAGENGPLIVWRPEYSVGVEQIDGQHQRLIRLLNEIHIRLHDAATPITAVFERLKLTHQEALQHFHSEEKYFSQLPGQLAEQPRLSHEGLLKELKRAIDDNESSDHERLLSLISGYLKFWLLDHILNTDSRLREYLK